MPSPCHLKPGAAPGLPPSQQARRDHPVLRPELHYPDAGPLKITVDVALPDRGLGETERLAEGGQVDGRRQGHDLVTAHRRGHDGSPPTYAARSERLMRLPGVLALPVSSSTVGSAPPDQPLNGGQGDAQLAGGLRESEQHRAARKMRLRMAGDVVHDSLQITIGGPLSGCLP